MTDWIPTLERRKREIYLELAEKMSAAIRSGDLKPGEQLPTQLDMADKLGITVGTVGRADMLVEQQGLISGEVGRGSFVRGPAAAVRSPKLEPALENVIDLSINSSLTSFHGESLSRTLAELSRADGLEQLVTADRRRHLRAALIERRVVRAHEPERDVAKPAVDLCDAMKEVGGFIGRAVCRERAREIVDLGEQRRSRR